MNTLSPTERETLKTILISWEEVNIRICQEKNWDLVMFFPSFSAEDGRMVLQGIKSYSLNEIVEFDSRYIDGDVDFLPECLPPTLEVIMGNDDRDMFSVPRVLTTRHLNFIALMTGEYWCLYGEKKMLEGAVGTPLLDFQQKTKETLMKHYGETELLTYQEKLKTLQNVAD